MIWFQMISSGYVPLLKTIQQKISSFACKYKQLLIGTVNKNVHDQVLCVSP